MATSRSIEDQQLHDATGVISLEASQLSDHNLKTEWISHVMSLYDSI